MKNLLGSLPVAKPLSWRAHFRFLKEHASRRLLWLGLSLLFLGAFIKISWELHEGPELDILDEKILLYISSYRVAALNGSAVDLTALGSPTVITLFTGVGVMLLALKRNVQDSLYLAIGSVGAGVATFGTKHTFTRLRPSIVPRLVEVSGYSYPSGHSLGATSFYLLLMFLSWRTYRLWRDRLLILGCTSLLIAGVCFSRLYLGVHYPSDVLSGALLGAAWVCLLTVLFSTPEENTPRLFSGRV